jgi:Holliday junction resolvase RusA-like endonuclease
LTQWLIKNSFKGIRLDGFVVLELLFLEPVPASASKKDKALMLAGEIIPTRCDNTNMQKFCEDCLKDIVFQDDRYVAKNISSKLYGDKGKTLVKVWTLSEYRQLNENHTREH